MILRTLLYTKLQSECSGLPIAKCNPTSFIQGRICPQWLISKGDRQMLQRSNFKIRLLVGCDGLEWDASRFRGGERSPTCKLCHSAAEDATHFLLVCPALQSTREMLLSRPPPILSAYTSSPNLLISYLLGTSWLDDLPTQKFAVNYIHGLRKARADLIMQ